METIGKPVPKRAADQRRSSKSAVVSAALHVLVLGCLVHQSRSWIAPIRLPGSEHGANLILTYSPGRAPLATSALHSKTPPMQPIPSTPLPSLLREKAKSAEPTPNTASPASTQPDSIAGADALGSGDINIALASFFPTPQPDLSALPRGTKGDVILDIVIDSAGKVADLKMTSGLGHGIDQSVIATVQQWTFHPATRDGQPVASEQELHFHYEKA